MSRGLDDRRLSELFHKHGPSVYRRALRMLGSRADAEEATQEVFIRVMRGEDAFEGRSQVTTWLYRITTNYCLNLIRDQRRRRDLLEERRVAQPGGVGPMGEEPTPSASPGDLVLLRRLLAEADPRQAQAAIYVFLDGMSHEEAAEVLGVSKRTVGNLLERFRERAARRVAAEEAPAPSVARNR